jgi:hypothetical protein
MLQCNIAAQKEITARQIRHHAPAVPRLRGDRQSVLGGVPHQDRSNSLSAAFRNLAREAGVGDRSMLTLQMR